jgi:hypothetical protein
MPNIFISYSHNNREQAELIIKLLTRFDEDYDIWWDFQIRSGANWRKTIEREIRNRDIFIFLMSADSVSSDYCHEELRIAQAAKRFLLPVIIQQPIDNSALPEDVAGYINDYQYVDLSSNEDKSFELTKLFNALKWYEESIADTSMSATRAVEVAKAIQAESELNLADFNSAPTRRAYAIEAAQWLNDVLPMAKQPVNYTQRMILMGLLIGFLMVLFFGIIFLFSFFAGLTSSAKATTDFSTAVEQRIMTRNANATIVAASAVTNTPSNTPSATIDRSATAAMLALIAEEETESVAATSAQGTREASTATALFETQSAQLTDDAPTNTPLPTDTPIPTETVTLTPSNTPTSTANATETAQYELDASRTAIAQQTASIIEQTSVHETAVAEQKAVATQAPTEIFPNGRLLKFYYNDGSFYMQNNSERRIRLSRISFQGMDEAGQFVSDLFVGTRWLSVSGGYSFIDSNGHCTGIEFFSSDTTPLEPETCDSNYNALLRMSINTDSVFWRPDAEIAHFAVFWDGQEIARCPIETGFCEVRAGN